MRKKLVEDQKAGTTATHWNCTKCGHRGNAAKEEYCDTCMCKSRPADMAPPDMASPAYLDCAPAQLVQQRIGVANGVLNGDPAKLTTEQAVAVAKTGLSLLELKAASPSVLDRLGGEVGCSAKEIILIRAALEATFGASSVECSYAELRSEISELKTMVAALTK